MFLLANVVIDLEPLAVMTLQVDYPLHGLAHSLLCGGVLGAGWGYAAMLLRPTFSSTMHLFGLPYSPTRRQAVLSGVLGAWLYVLFEAPLYADIRPFYPLACNPRYGAVSSSALYSFCLICFLPALMLYGGIAIRHARDKSGSRH